MPPNRRSSDMDSILSNSSNETSTSIQTCRTNAPFYAPYPKPLPDPPGDLFSSPPPAIYSEYPPLPPLPIRQTPVVAPQTLLPLIPRKQAMPTRKQIYRRHSRRSHPHCYLRRRTLLLLSVVSVTLSIAAVTILSAMLIEQTKEKDAAFPEGSYEACLKCIILNENPGDTRDDPLFKHLHNKIEKGDIYCCAQTSQGLSALLQLMTRRLQNISIPEPISTNHYKFSPVSAHVTFKANEKSNQDLNSKALLLLNYVSTEDLSQPTHARQVAVTNNSIRILHTGWYYVYSSVYFNSPSGKPCKDLKYQTWGNYISRHSHHRPDQTGCLVKTAHTCCDNCKSDHHTSFTGGVFYFLNGDLVYVETSGDGVVLFEEKASYFGLVMLGTNKPDEPSKS